ncbi:uncharacterized protein MELLADRAFT_67124 [Melampsora larici-populina 98AG31]|uniref:DUF6604 domain-containing protein n=1 Tax=Melampsora larici-populina (strain 98AG31 / pathotype 3-4-7) TaxID=747676 RepID=F4S1V8_MELLP|nr:uncharacterized protein MELLADRAFT_67124 [Melampsora larici-populina 98AG31]EGG01373.1 hypothetical protein MELLADRAFT_67124 [Melampsora larici-populina 98AG31]
MTVSTTLFSNTYQLYKSYTSDVCQWLMDAAGYNPPNEAHDASPAQPPTRGTGRLKGKARKLAKDTVPSAAPNKKVLETPIAVDQLVELAQNISQDPKKMLNIPKTIITKLQKTISLRQDFLALHAARPSPKNIPSNPGVQEGNASHAYFVRILERVLRILTPQAPPSQEVNPKISPIDPSATEVPKTVHNTNNFHVLDVEDLEYEDETTQKPTLAPKNVGNGANPPKPAIQAKAVLADRNEKAEAFFATFCLFTDMNRLQVLVRDHWKQYKAGTIALETVSLMSNMAIAALRQTEKDFISTFGHLLPSPPTCENISLHIYLYLCLQRGVDPTVRYDANDVYNHEMADVGELLGLTTHSTLESIRNVVQPNQIPWSIPGVFGVYDRNADRSKMSLRQIIAQDRVILIELFSEFCILENCRAPDRFEDEFTKGIRKLYDTKKNAIPIWLVFATQVFLDTNSILGPEVTRPFEELQKAAKQVDTNLDRFFASRKGVPDFELWPKKQTDTLHRLQDQVVQKYMLADTMTQMKIVCKGTLDRRTPAGRQLYNEIETGPPFNLRKQHPLLCGTELLALRSLSQDAGISVGCTWGSILYTTHAYNAFRQAGALDVEWPLMEWIISYFTPERLFAGFRPQTLEECFKSLLLGTSLSNFTPDARRSKSNKGVRWSSKGPRNWSANSKVLDILKDWLSGTDSADVAGRMLACLMALNDKTKTSSSAKVVPVGTVGQVLTVKAMIEHEIPWLRCDFLDLHLRCMDAFRDMRRELDGHFSKMLDPLYIENDNQLCMMVGYILMISSHNRKVLEEKYKKKVPDEIQSLSIVTGARVMKELILKSV